MKPVPTQPIPILIGGHAEPALRRAARLGDGWMHAGGDAADAGALLARLRELRREYGREREPFEIHVISLDAYTRDGVRRLEDQGVTDVIVGFRNVLRARHADPAAQARRAARLRRPDHRQGLSSRYAPSQRSSSAWKWRIFASW